MKKFELKQLVKECLEEKAVEMNSVPEMTLSTSIAKKFYEILMRLNNASSLNKDLMSKLKREIDNKVTFAADKEQLKSYFNWTLGNFYDDAWETFSETVNEQLTVNQTDDLHKTFLDSHVENIAMASDDKIVNIKFVNGVVIEFKSNSPITVKNLGPLN